MFILSTAPTFAFAAEENAGNQTEDQSSPYPNKYALQICTQKMLEMANRTAMRIEYLIEIIYANETLLEVLQNASLLDDLEGNVTLFNNATNLLDDALTAIGSGEYEAAAAKITEAMKILREVYRAIRMITEEHMAVLKSQVVARGLLIAMQRALERIDRIRTLVSADAENITRLLNEAEQYLNITVAEELLAEGNVTAVSHNLVKANQLINKACLLLKQKARMMIWARVKHYLNGMEKTLQKVTVKIALAKMKGINVSAVLEELGYQNETQFREALLDMIMTARGKASGIKEAMLELQKISQTFWRMDRALTRHLHQHEWKHHESWGEQGQNHNQTQSNAGSRGAGLGRGNNSNSSRRGRP